MSKELIPVSRPDIGSDEYAAVQRVFSSGWLGHGAQVIEFEKEISKFLGDRYVVAVSTGTAALHLALHALGIKPGDEVILPSLTFCSCPQVVTQLGAQPVFCDVDDQTLTLDVADVSRCISQKTRAIMPVHFCSTVCDMIALHELARNKKVAVVEDAAHAFGCSYQDGSLVGSSEAITCFSFDPIKNLTCGEGGAVVLSDKALYETMSRARMMGIDRDGWKRNSEGWGAGYAVTAQGFRCHMSNINAAIGLAQLARFGELREKRRKIAKRYCELLQDIHDIQLPSWEIQSVVPFAFMFRVKGGLRDALRECLHEAGIQTAIHYPPNHLQPAFQQFRRTLPITENVVSEILTVPLFPSMLRDQVDHVIKCIRHFFGLNVALPLWPEDKS